MKRIPKTLALGVVSVVCALLLVACGNDHHKVTVTSIAVGPATATINAGGTQQYTAIESLSNGMTMDVTTQVTWNSSNPAAATINTSSGLATGVGSGTTTIMATLSGVNGTATLTVIGATKVTVTPITKTIMAGATFQFMATATIPAAGGGTTMQDVTQTATWSSSDMTIGTINSTGLATGVAMGSTTITASFEGATGTANLTVGTPVVIGLLITPANPTIAVGTTSSLSAVELISDGTTQPTTGAVTWVSSDTTKVTVTASEAGTMFMGAPFMGTTTVTVQAAVARFAYLADAFSTTDDVFNV